MIKARIRWCSCRVENILTLGKLLRLWFCFILCLLYLKPLIVHTNNFSYELASPIMGTIFLLFIALWFTTLMNLRPWSLEARTNRSTVKYQTLSPRESGARETKAVARIHGYRHNAAGLTLMSLNSVWFTCGGVVRRLEVWL